MITIIQLAIAMAALNTPGNYKTKLKAQFKCESTNKKLKFIVKGTKVSCKEMAKVQAYMDYLKDRGIKSNLEDTFGRY